MNKTTDELYIEGVKWYKSKTFWTAILDILSSASLILTGEAELALTLQAVWLPLIALWIRMGINKVIVWK